MSKLKFVGWVLILALFVINPVYRELLSRVATLEATKLNLDAAAPGIKPSPALAQAKAEFEMTKARLQKLESETRDQVRGARRIALEQERSSFEARLDISTSQMSAFEKELEKKKQEAEDAGRSSITAQMARAELENVEQVLRAIAMDKEFLRIEINARPRVSQCGPATVPESPD
jgi:hypothetical protein